MDSESEDDWEARVQAEMARVERAEATPLGRLSRIGTRFLVRSLRILAGLIIGILAWWAGSVATDILGIPFAAQSLLGVFKGLGLAVLAIWLAVSAFSSAFGSGPSSEDERERRRRIAMQRVEARQQPFGMLDATNMKATPAGHAAQPGRKEPTIPS